MKKLVKIQKLKVIQVKKDSSHTEQSSYWDDVETNKGSRELGDTRENVQANPDRLADTIDSSPSTPQLLMGEAVSRLAGRQKECYILTMREGKSLAEAAEILGIEKGSVQKYRERAIRFIQGYCDQAIKGGRV